MLAIRLIKQLKLPKARQFSSTSVKGDKSVPAASLPKSDTPKSEGSSPIGEPIHHVSNFDKRILVWVKRYPSIEAIPAEVSMDCIKKAHTKARIKVCNIMIVLAIIGFISSAISGKRGVASGQNIISQRLEWMQQQKEKGRAEAAAAAAVTAAAGEN